MESLLAGPRDRRRRRGGQHGRCERERSGRCDRPRGRGGGARAVGVVHAERRQTEQRRLQHRRLRRVRRQQRGGPRHSADGADTELFTFVDKRPASTVHLLVIPRRFIRDASALAPEDLPLVGRMEAKARALVQRTVGADAFDERELALGFHWPPWYSVPWLHLHAIYPKSAMSRRWKYTAVSFYSPDRVREIIGRR